VELVAMPQPGFIGSQTYLRKTQREFQASVENYMKTFVQQFHAILLESQRSSGVAIS
jgi:hypothetical protein